MREYDSYSDAVRYSQQNNELLTRRRNDRLEKQHQNDKEQGR